MMQVQPKLILSTTSTQPPVNPSVEDTITKTLMYAAYLYDNQGVRIKNPFIKVYTAVVVAKTPCSCQRN
ncbi:SLAP domain-containing protein [Lactobacillus johnsonii]|uniref:S-layer protein C-terminal domain-containing protein n=1 Tax=Lactobacillus johnsonii (strain FI9785) TaxID=633699 RepID=D0R2R5_LACJF|nr:SLAP domain-containing protein [Lactobacillus johnsonii]CAX65970.1 hypothetical protein predicted by Glimmer/Critica [Lactobacillus johnsonii FI9785]